MLTFEKRSSHFTARPFESLRSRVRTRLNLLRSNVSCSTTRGDGRQHAGLKPPLVPDESATAAGKAPDKS
ncbi:hypothetical protein EVAR_83101_1 [Eumeta japonica]|uniref:Uncharacterized protein n=1 Tax=Eumeta variegata TaxID=151549 RepID=A0A4C1WN02_EUMVA|nr:hypothetical protein EVAR_83101_1 [Eumeta japonica]